MNPRGLFSSYATLTAVYFLLCAPVQAQSSSLAIQGVTVVDVIDGSLAPDRAVIIEGNRIAVIGSVAQTEVPEGATIVEAAGSYLIPGLWDLHVHATSPEEVRLYFPLFLASGITGIRDTWGSREVAAEAAAAVSAGELAGPVRLVVAGNLVDGPARTWPTSQVAITPEDGRRIVDSLHAAGAPFVKVLSSLLPDTYVAIAERSRMRGIPFAGHVPRLVRAADVSAAGQRSMEHFMGVLEGCSSEEEAILAGLRQGLGAILASDTTRTVHEVLEEADRRALASQDDERCRALAARFVENETWQVPTLVTLRGYAYMRELAAAGDPRLLYLPPPMSYWFPETNRFASQRTERQWATMQARYERDLELVRLMSEAGVPFLAGSDTPNPWAFPGSGLHDELELMVQAGLTPLQALQAATLNPARFFGRTDDLGTVESGKLADLVLLDGNPLEDIKNTRQIRALVADGRLYQRADLDGLLAEIKAFHRQDDSLE